MRAPFVIYFSFETFLMMNAPNAVAEITPIH